MRNSHHATANFPQPVDTPKKRNGGEMPTCGGLHHLNSTTTSSSLSTKERLHLSLRLLSRLGKVLVQRFWRASRSRHEGDYRRRAISCVPQPIKNYCGHSWWPTCNADVDKRNNDKITSQSRAFECLRQNLIKHLTPMD